MQADSDAEPDAGLGGARGEPLPDSFQDFSAAASEEVPGHSGSYCSDVAPQTEGTGWSPEGVHALGPPPPPSGAVARLYARPLIFATWSALQMSLGPSAPRIFWMIPSRGPTLCWKNPLGPIRRFSKAEKLQPSRCE